MNPIKILASLLLMVFVVSACGGNVPIPASTIPPSPTPALQNSATGIQVVFDTANYPFMYAENGQADGKAAGLYPAIIEAVFKRMGTPVNVTSFPWKRALEMGERGEAAIGGIYKNEQRLLVFDYSDPIYTEHLYIFVRKGESFSYTTTDDLKGKMLGVIRGWSYGDVFDQAKEAGVFAVEENVSDIANFEKLLLSRVDCIIVDGLAAQQIIQKFGYQDQVERLETPVTTNDTFLVFAKSTQQTELLKRFNETLAAMKQDGSYDELVKSFEAPQ